MAKAKISFFRGCKRPRDPVGGDPTPQVKGLRGEGSFNGSTGQGGGRWAQAGQKESCAHWLRIKFRV